MPGRRLLGNTLEEKLLLNSTMNENGCRIWQRAISRENGYGRLWHGKKDSQVHRLAFELWIEPLRDGMCVCHKCDEPLCLEPTHLFQDTPAGNSKDMTGKGRQAKGEAAGGAIFCEYDILEIRALYAAGFGQSELAKMYDVARTTIYLIVKRKSWNHLLQQVEHDPKFYPA